MKSKFYLSTILLCAALSIVNAQTTGSEKGFGFGVGVLPGLFLNSTVEEIDFGLGVSGDIEYQFGKIFSGGLSLSSINSNRYSLFEPAILLRWHIGTLMFARADAGLFIMRGEDDYKVSPDISISLGRRFPIADGIFLDWQFIRASVLNFDPNFISTGIVLGFNNTGRKPLTLEKIIEVPGKEKVVEVPKVEYRDRVVPGPTVEKIVERRVEVPVDEKITVPFAAIYFNPNVPDIIGSSLEERYSAYKVLWDVKRYLELHEDYLVSIQGYANRSGSASGERRVEQELSTARAKEAADWLTKGTGISKDRLITVGNGGTSDSSPSGNRRVEFTILKQVFIETFEFVPNRRTFTGEGLTSIQQMTALQKIVRIEEYLRNNQNSKIWIEGYETPEEQRTARTKYQLADDRALKTKEQFITDNIDDKRIIMVGSFTAATAQLVRVIVVEDVK